MSLSETPETHALQHIPRPNRRIARHCLKLVRRGIHVDPPNNPPFLFFFSLLALLAQHNFLRHRGKRRVSVCVSAYAQLGGNPLVTHSNGLIFRWPCMMLVSRDTRVTPYHHSVPHMYIRQSSDCHPSFGRRNPASRSSFCIERCLWS